MVAAEGCARSSPIGLIDPTGLYSCTGTESQCSAFEEARQANLGRKGDVRATAHAYGDPGEENSFTLAFGESEPGAAANVIVDLPYSQEAGFSLVAAVTIDPALTGTELEAIVGHEGQHLVDARVFAATVISEGAGWWDLSKNLTHRQLEANAYAITHKILGLSNTPMAFRGARGPVELGKLSGQRRVNTAIEKIVDGPLYADVLGRLQFPAFGFQPQR